MVILNKYIEDQMLQNKKLFMILAIFYIILSSLLSYYGLFGNWKFKILNAEYSWMWDPDSAYLASGITFFEHHYVWLGHPGLPVMVIIQIISRCLYLLSLVINSSSHDYYDFSFRNIFYIIFLSKIMISIVHLTTSFFIYKLSIKLFNNNFIAFCSSLLYLTSFPVLFYLTKIAPDSFVSFFVILTLLSLISIKEKDKTYFKKYVLLTLSSLFIALAIFSKMTIALPLFFVPFFFVILVEFSDRKKYILLIIYVLFFAIFINIFGQKTDWKVFFNFWFSFSPGNEKYIYNQSLSWEKNIAVNFLTMINNLFNMVISKDFWIIWLDPTRFLFLKSEIIFLILSIFGFIWIFLFDKSKRKIHLFIFITFVLLLPLSLYKSAFWYFFAHISILSIYTPICLNLLLKKRVFNRINPAFFAIITVLLINSYTIYNTYFLKLNDIISFRNWSPYFYALRNIKEGDLIQLVGAPGPGELLGHLEVYLPSENFAQYLQKYFIYAKENTTNENIDPRIKFTIINKNNKILLLESSDAEAKISKK
jgi:Dolichyl-phosphate-mannose-protein mannosyltransferase